LGGSGSGRWNHHERKRTTEECSTLDVGDLPRDMLDGGTLSGVLRALRFDGERSVLRVSWALELVGESPVLTLSYRPHGPRRRAEGRELIERVRLLTTKPHFGGARWWFVCPFQLDGEACQRRVGKLYLPPGQSRFGCRRCHDLTYKSSQEGHRYDRLCALMAGEDSGESFQALRRFFLFNARIARGQVTRAPRSPLEAFDEVLGKR
jgi:hypothetical protein